MKSLIITALLFPSFFSSQSQTKNFLDQPYMEVSGYADTLIIPDEIFIKIVISEKDTKDRTSVEELEIRMVNSLKALNIETEKNLSANDMASHFAFYFLNGKEVLKSKQYILKVKDAVTASKVFIQLEELGISNTSIDRVNYSDLENAKNFMRAKAVENAKARAVALLKPLNQVVGPAIHIADSENYNNNNLQGQLQGVVVTGYFKTNQLKDELPKIDFEKIRVTTNVQVKFVLK